jgi:hypothetical protein
VKRVAVDEQNVGQRSGLDHAELALEPHQFAADRRRATQGLRRRIAEELDEMPDVAGVLAHRRQLEPIVSADHHLHAALSHLLVGAASRFELARQMHFLDYVARHPDRVALEDRVVHEPEGGTDDDPVLRRLQHVERLFIGEIAVIDAIDMIAHGALDRRRGARVGRDALVPLMRDLDRGRDLALAHRCDLGPGVGDEFVARDVDLDVVDPLATAKAHRAPDLVGPIGDHAEAFGVNVLLALVAQAAGHRDFRPGGAVARSGEIAVLDLLAHDHIETQLGRRRRVA